MTLSALQMPFTDPAGDAHPAAVWVPAQVVMDNVDRTGSVTWYAYHDSAALLAGDQPVQGGQHQTVLGSALYAQVVAFPLTQGTYTYGAATTAALIFLAQTVADTPTGQANADGTPVLASFFAAAQVVTLG